MAEATAASLARGKRFVLCNHQANHGKSPKSSAEWHSITNITEEPTLSLGPPNQTLPTSYRLVLLVAEETILE
jgi:hypothetical protein